jgi:hypothetical protein
MERMHPEDQDGLCVAGGICINRGVALFFLGVTGDEKERKQKGDQPGGQGEYAFFGGV